MNMNPRILVIPFALALSAGCASTTIDISAEPTTTVVSVTTLPDGAAATLQEMAVLADSLGNQIAKGGDAPKETLAQIEELWTAAAPELRRQRAELGLEIDHQVELIRTAVERKRPADADKAAQNLALVAANLAAA